MQEDIVSMRKSFGNNEPVIPLKKTNNSNKANIKEKNSTLHGLNISLQIGVQQNSLTGRPKSPKIHKKRKTAISSVRNFFSSTSTNLANFRKGTTRSFKDEMVKLRESTEQVELRSTSAGGFYSSI